MAVCTNIKDVYSLCSVILLLRIYPKEVEVLTKSGTTYMSTVRRHRAQFPQATVPGPSLPRSMVPASPFCIPHMEAKRQLPFIITFALLISKREVPPCTHFSNYLSYVLRQMEDSTMSAEVKNIPIYFAFRQRISVPRMDPAHFTPYLAVCPIGTVMQF